MTPCCIIFCFKFLFFYFYPEKPFPGLLHAILYFGTLSSLTKAILIFTVLFTVRVI